MEFKKVGGLALVKKKFFKMFSRFDIISCMEKYFCIYFIVKFKKVFHQN